MSLPHLIWSALAGLGVLFSGSYLAARRVDNYGLVDIVWSYAFALVGVFYALAAPGWIGRRALMATLVGLWSLRLGTHLARRVIAHHPVEDGRYGQLRRDWAAHFGPKMFGFFLVQAGSVALLSVPFLLPALNPAPSFHPLELAGSALWLAAIAGEATADAQLARFKRTNRERGGVCDSGLWRYSRHPNYFFEWLVWVAYALFALASPWGALALVGPAIILYLLLRVTGIPLTEEQALRSKGDAYRRYQQATSPFVPWFSRRLP